MTSFSNSSSYTFLFVPSDWGIFLGFLFPLFIGFLKLEHRDKISKLLYYEPYFVRKVQKSKILLNPFENLYHRTIIHLILRNPFCYYLYSFIFIYINVENENIISIYCFVTNW